MNLSVRRVFLQLLAFLSWNHCTAQGEQQCVLENREGEPKGILVPAVQCATFWEQLEHGDFHATDDERRLVCCPVFQSEPNCGRISQYADVFSFDSRETQLDQFTWAAVILPRWIKKVLCSGSLISTRFVLSAAHCFVDASGVSKPESNYRVRLGDWDLANDEDCMYVRGVYVCNLHQPKDYAVEKIISHASFHQGRKDFLHDIALLRLAKSVEYSFQIGPACLPEWNIEVPDIVDQKLVATGWGRTNAFMGFNRKYKLEMLGRNISTCVKIYALREADVSRIHLCARGARRRDVCYGDSGGGLMRREANHWLQGSETVDLTTGDMQRSELKNGSVWDRVM
uniref:Peptidase S1 domain-containing protein n=1 Tax=Anopheles culicifacies TaxID=139723 RepID=A0A182M8R1_9DIPT